MEPTLAQIIKDVTNYTNLDILKKTRKREYIYAKRIYYKLAKQLTYKSLEDIGKELEIEETQKKQYHASVIHNLKGFYELEMYEPKFYHVYLELYNNYKNSNSIVVMDVNLLSNKKITF